MPRMICSLPYFSSLFLYSEMMNKFKRNLSDIDFRDIRQYVPCHFLVLLSWLESIILVLVIGYLPVSLLMLKLCSDLIKFLLSPPSCLSTTSVVPCFTVVLDKALVFIFRLLTVFLVGLLLVVGVAQVVTGMIVAATFIAVLLLLLFFYCLTVNLSHRLTYHIG